MKIAHPINKIAIILALVSFLIGTSLLLLYICFKWSALLHIGINYVRIAFLVNAIFLAFLIINALFFSKDTKENLITILLFLLNIPITLIYIQIV
ncbi:hypothetical protein IWQ47_000702 [Aquimarina sp. EL_43]|uniref:hypothetical protein n=1 Tax=Aquimarina TaxID=290174 RepID=UPI0004712299|nr:MULTISPECIES: hypothetical protein [Aquimarina]MBG6128608.1 hypothetical protein [Aquimarina sp. EL_35]MBG6149671.1 hypothetical protein [Aquimarina sp. EL_32]MBG6167644.1 hypothetical protein [Aquimarina sp. EL_43]